MREPLNYTASHSRRPKPLINVMVFLHILRFLKDEENLLWNVPFHPCFVFLYLKYVDLFDAAAWSDLDSKPAITRIIKCEWTINASTALLEQYTAAINCTVLFWLHHEGRLFLYFKGKIFMVFLMRVSCSADVVKSGLEFTVDIRMSSHSLHRKRERVCVCVCVCVYVCVIQRGTFRSARLSLFSHLLDWKCTFRPSLHLPFQFNKTLHVTRQTSLFTRTRPQNSHVTSSGKNATGNLSNTQLSPSPF